jgi:hypothetical protein
MTTTNRKHATSVECRWCGKNLDWEEAENPRRDGDGDPICDNCWHDYYEFTCCWCQNYDEIQHQNYLAIVEPTRSEYGVLGIGIYKIIDAPYFGGPLIGQGYLFADSLEFAAKLPDGIDTNGYPCGHLCRECQCKITATAKTQKVS